MHTINASLKLPYLSVSMYLYLCQHAHVCCYGYVAVTTQVHTHATKAYVSTCAQIWTVVIFKMNLVGNFLSFFCVFLDVCIYYKILNKPLLLFKKKEKKRYLSILVNKKITYEIRTFLGGASNLYLKIVFDNEIFLMPIWIYTIASNLNLFFVVVVGKMHLILFKLLQ